MAKEDFFKVDFPKLSLPNPKNKPYLIILVVVILSLIFGGGAGFLVTNFYFQKNLSGKLSQQNQLPLIKKETIIQNHYVPQTTQEEKVIEAVKSTSPAVVSIIITKPRNLR